MADPPTREQILLRDMGFTESHIERRKRIVDLGLDDLRRISLIRGLVIENIEGYATAFFDRLSDLEEARGLFATHRTLERARRLKRDHLVAMVQGEYGIPYVEQRLTLGLLYSDAGLAPPVFLGAFHHLLKSIGTTIAHRFARTPLEGFESFMALKKIAFLDIGIIVDAIVFERQRVIRQQQDAIRELSTPVLLIRDRLLLLPIIGVIDGPRARLITENLLRSIVTTRAKVVVIDLTGVATIDSTVAHHLLHTVRATELMGAVVIVTGLSSDVAQALTALGIDLATLATEVDLQGGIEVAERILRPGAGDLVGPDRAFGDRGIGR